MYNSVNICRSCLSTGDGLLSMESTIDDWLTISNCFKIHLNVNAREDDGLPFKICLVCLDTLLKVRKFHLRFLESEQRLLGQYVNPDNQKPETEAFTSEIVNDVNDFDELPDFTSTADAQDLNDDPLDSNSSFLSAGHSTDMTSVHTSIQIESLDCENSSDIDDLVEHYDSESEVDVTKEIVTDTSNDKTDIVRRKNPRLIYCLQCHKEFETKNELRTHFHSEHGNDNTKGFCIQCSTTFPTRGKLMTHLRTHKHPNSRFDCTYCDKKFSTESKLTSHERTHTGEKPYVCSICGRGFSQSSVLRTHMSLHTGKTEKCPKCDKKFSRISFLKVHLRVHDDIRPYACHLCDKKYRIKSHLTSHILTHSDARNFTCDVCGQSFKEKCVLRSHMNIHTRPYKCPQCPLRAAKLYSFRIHLVKMHNIRDDPKLFMTAGSDENGH
ncbi:unnamed protein product [Hermetia illucens]|uniref:Uncharacterized protein n=1 Tax=Hermetia illucens TaxID=343691 RepID=A0A7R8V1U2_HERIL|nr:zinc finger protein OZF-like isoform X1 [Hermetia illucens]CAD7090660.1 unnamed protein product [Hermetia illucens]